MYPDVLSWGVLHIRSYGLMMAIAFLVGTWLALREARRLSIDEDKLTSVILVVLVSSIVGARALYVLEHVQAFRREWGSVVAVWEGGLTLYGGVVAGTIGGLLMARHLGLPMWKVADAVTPSFALGTMFGRVGCYLNGCCYGVPTTMPWGVHFPDDSFASLEFGNAAVHPSQLYFAFAGLLLFLVTWTLRKRFEVPGTLFWLFMLLFAMARVILDMTRAYEPEAMVATWGMVTLHESQVVSIALALFSTLMILRLRRLAPAPA